ncbi:MAG TPA: prepilin-type N-terminal cleavage/methylation domain-containing protein [Luteolibacter sp.]
MKTPLTFRDFRDQNAFSLVEVVAVLAILATLLAVGVSLQGVNGGHSRKSATDTLTGLIEQARTTAITSRSCIVLAIAEPGDLPGDDERCRIGLIKMESDQWPDSTSSSLELSGVLLNRWQALNGIVLIGGEVDGVVNPLDLPQVSITCKGAKTAVIRVHAIAFNCRGGLRHPSGSAPIAVRIAEGAYRGGKAVTNMRGGGKAIAENRLKIGRVTARPYRIDG